MGVPPNDRPGRRGAGALVALLVLGGLGAVLIALAWAALDQRPERDGGSTEDRLRPADVARGTAATDTAPIDAAADLPGWAAGVAGRTDIPARVLQAYAAAEVTQRAATPDCRVSWATLAGIGRVESRHATLGGTKLDDGGVAGPPVIGIPLDGRPGTRQISDTDGGRLDGDTTWDRAVGPMQFLPQTWARFGADGNGDGVRDPQQIDDAALAAAGYLCADGRDLGSGPEWWDAVLAYNRSGEYVRLVWAGADRYATAVDGSPTAG